jgi:hypothetical protein
MKLDASLERNTAALPISRGSANPTDRIVLSHRLDRSVDLIGSPDLSAGDRVLVRAATRPAELLEGDGRLHIR